MKIQKTYFMLMVADMSRAIAFYRRLGYVAESLCLVKTFD